MGLTSLVVCGVVPAGAIYSAGMVAWRLHTGTIGTMEGPLLTVLTIATTKAGADRSPQRHGAGFCSFFFLCGEAGE